MHCEGYAFQHLVGVEILHLLSTHTSAAPEPLTTPMPLDVQIEAS